jgi:hypothetical protein
MASFQIIYQTGYEITDEIKKNVGEDTVKAEKCTNVHKIYTYM